MRRGREIGFVSRKYMGKAGWNNDEHKETAKMQYIIVDLGNGRAKRPQVNKESVGKPLGTPSSYAEAVLQQCPDIKAKLDKLCLACQLQHCHRWEWHFGGFLGSFKISCTKQPVKLVLTLKLKCHVCVLACARVCVCMRVCSVFLGFSQ
jgi:hypothetical protein